VGDGDGGDLFGWAKKSIVPAVSKAAADEEDPIAALLRSNVKVFEHKAASKLLKPGARLEYTKLQNANAGYYHSSVVTAVEFHPKEEGLMVTTGLDRPA
jgi:hypothetical protein